MRLCQYLTLLHVTTSSVVFRMDNLKLKSSNNSTSPEHNFTPLIEIKTGSAQDCTRSSKPRITTPAQDRYIRVSHLRNRAVTATTTAADIQGLRRISTQTVRNRLRQRGILSRRPYVGPIWSHVHGRERDSWCHTLRVWTLRNWRRIWLSD